MKEMQSLIVDLDKPKMWLVGVPAMPLNDLIKFWMLDVLCMNPFSLHRKQEGRLKLTQKEGWNTEVKSLVFS